MKKFSLVLFWVLSSVNIQAQTPINSDFTYQGELIFNNQLVTGSYDFEYAAYDALTLGNIYDAPGGQDAIPVVNGIFTLALDFGDGTFLGNEVFLEISVRENGSGLAYEPLLPRQKLTSSPYAIHAQFVGFDSVTNDEILDGSITTQDFADDSVTLDKISDNAVGSNEIIDNSITSIDIATKTITASNIGTDAVTSGKIATDAVRSSEIASNAVGTSEIISTQVQRRVSGSCTVGNYIRSVNEDGTVICETDNTGNSAVTSADIVDGTIASIDMANNSITNSKIVSNAIDVTKMQDNSIGSNEIINQSITSNDIASNSISASMIVANAVGSSEIANNAVGASEIATGAVGSSEIATNAVKSAEIADNAVGSSELIAGAVGESEINTAEVQKRVTQSCGEYYYLNGINQDGSVSCERLPLGFDNVIDTNNSSGRFNSIAIGSDGFPIISYYLSSSDNLKIIHCNNEICSQRTNLTLDSIGDVGSHNSIAIGNDGLPIISYHDETNGDLKILHCGNLACNSGNVITVVDSLASVGEYTSIIIGNDNLPIISYYDTSNSDLKVLHCGNITCTSGNTVTTVDSSSGVGRFNSIAIGSDNLAIISYYDDLNNNLKILHCGNINCNSGNFQNIVDNSSTDVGRYSSLTIGNDNKPIISYLDETNGDLMVLHCGNTVCSSGNTITTVDSEGRVGIYSNIIIASDGYPIISYYDNILDKLKILKCLERDCSANPFAPEWLITTLRTLDVPSGPNSIVIGNDNNPIISYDGESGFNVIACGDALCIR